MVLQRQISIPVPNKITSLEPYTTYKFEYSKNTNQVLLKQPQQLRNDPQIMPLKQLLNLQDTPPRFSQRTETKYLENKFP